MAVETNHRSQEVHLSHQHLPRLPSFVCIATTIPSALTGTGLPGAAVYDSKVSEANIIVCWIVMTLNDNISEAS
jgi:hypothetical protein